jgi:enolase
VSDTIRRIEAREILGGTGRPTVEVELTTAAGVTVVASAPSGTSAGRHEAREVRDGGRRYGGFGALKAAENVNRIIAPALAGRDVCDQRGIDKRLVALEGTGDKGRLGVRAVLAVSMAAAKAGARAAGVPLYRHLGDGRCLPVPLATVIAGGRHSPSPLDFEDYLLVADGFGRFGEALEALAGVRQALADILAERFGAVPEVGGALAPPIAETAEAFEVMLKAAAAAGAAGRVGLGVDVVGSELYDASAGRYRAGGRELTAEQVVDYLVELASAYPLRYIEDSHDQDDFAGFAALTAALPGRQVVGDDLFAGRIERLRKGSRLAACNTLLLKLNQAGTVTETLDAGRFARDNGYDVAVSIRSCDTNDSLLADLAVALDAGQIKLGSPVRGERNAKYNRLLKIEAELGAAGSFAGRA